MESYNERIDKIISSCTALSRKDVKKAAQAKRITLNGTPIKSCAEKATNTDILCLDGKQLHYTKFIYLMMNKPKGYVCSTDDPKSPIVLELLSPEYQKAELFSIGRLDKNTTGLVILTNDGKLAHDLLAPTKHVEKTYLVVLKFPYEDRYPELFSNGIVLDDGYKCKSATIEYIDKNKCTLTITEGKFHQIKRMFDAVGNKVVDLERLSMGDVTLDNSLKQADFRPLTTDEIKKLRSHK